MRDQIEVLASLQSLDQRVRNQMITKDEVLKEIRLKDQEVEAKRADEGVHRSQWEEKDKIRREKEKQLQEEGKKTTEKRMRMAQIKNIKEMQALQREIDLIKQSNSQLEEEVIALMEELEGEANALKEKKKELKALEEQWTEQRNGFESQLAEIEQAVAEDSKGRGELTARLNGDLIGRYELIFSRRGGLAVVTVSGGICEGCHMNIPHQLWNEIIKSDKLILCPSCHRIIYYEAPPSENEQV